MEMTTAIERLGVNEKERIKEAILAKLTGQLQDTARRKGEPVILRAEIDVKGLQALTWLRAQHPTSRGYWSDRENRFELAGSGAADVITGDSGFDYDQLMNTLHQRLATARGNPRYLGGLRFSINDRQDEAWRCFRAYRFILPRFEVVRRDGKTVFACNMLSNETLEAVTVSLARLSFPETDPSPTIPTPVSRHDHPDQRHWCTAVDAALKAFQPGRYEKVVLARKATFQFTAPLNAAAWLAALRRNTSHCFHFLFQPDAGAAFLGASPERLYRRDGDVIRTEAIAGSRPRGASQEEDNRLLKALATSEKDLREHGYVVQEIHRILSGMCNLLAADEKPGVLELRRCRHLITGFRGKLKAHVKDADLLRSLHPTPAVGGFPRDRALQDIARIEPFDRGWYAGPVGWIAKDAAQFVVGIRSGLTEGCRLHLFSGAGIVSGSVPEDEWDEIENKISDFLALFARPSNQ